MTTLDEKLREIANKYYDVDGMDRPRLAALREAAALGAREQREADLVIVNTAYWRARELAPRLEDEPLVTDAPAAPTRKERADA